MLLHQHCNCWNADVCWVLLPAQALWRAAAAEAAQKLKESALSHHGSEGSGLYGDPEPNEEESSDLQVPFRRQARRPAAVAGAGVAGKVRGWSGRAATVSSALHAAYPG